MFKLTAFGLTGLLLAVLGVGEGQSGVRTDLEPIDQRTSLGQEVSTFLHEWRADLLSRDPGRLARHARPDSKNAVVRELRDEQSALYKALYVGRHSVERVIKPVPYSGLVAFIHRMNAEGTYVLGCYERQPGAVAVPPGPHVELAKGLNAREAFCLDLVKDGGRWKVDYTFAGDDDGK